MMQKIVFAVSMLAILVLYTYMVIAGIGNLTGMTNEMAPLLGLTINAVGWFWLMFGVLLPVVCAVLAVWVAWRRSPGQQVLILALGVCVAALIQLEITHLIPPSIFFA